jgi:hypothetical protein
VTQTQLLADLIDDAIAVAFPIAMLFPLIGLPKIKFGPLPLQGFWPWYRSSWGWNLVVFDLVIGIAVLPAWLHRVLGLNPETLYFEWIEVIALWAVPISIVWRALLIWRVQRNVDVKEEENATTGF